MGALPTIPEFYQPYYCEENAYLLAESLGAGVEQRAILFISNPNHAVVLSHQRASPDGVIVWDYHVVVVAWTDRPYILDPDSRLGMPLPALTYLTQTFNPAINPVFAPRFRLVLFNRFRECFRSDRSHMKGDDGEWFQPPPPWDPIGDGGTNLLEFIDTEADFEGGVFDLPGLRNYLLVPDG